MEQSISDQPQDKPQDLLPEESKPKKRRISTTRLWAALTLVAFLFGSLGGYFVGINNHAGMAESTAARGEQDMAKLMEQTNPPNGFSTEASFGDIGPQLIAAGAFKLEDFVGVYQRANQPLNDEQKAILEKGSDAPVVFNRQNAYFLLNLFWALGLTNQNRVLEEGPMMRNGEEGVVNFASTGGWRLAARPVAELYSSTAIVRLTADQQERLEEVIITVYRPCCDNPTHFPDCNHGMAMLGLLQLMASQGASVEEMFEAAKYANAYWYPSQTLELAAFFQAKDKVSFSEVDASQLVSQQYSSLSGFKAVHQWLTNNGVLPQAPGTGSSCGV
jgi:hypothetical protein